MTPDADRLAARTLELVDIPSESLHEADVRARLRSLVPPSLTAAFIGEDAALWLPERHAGAPLVLLAGHYDTVPAQDNLPGRIEDGWVHGLGAADMKAAWLWPSRSCATSRPIPLQPSTSG